MVQGRSDARRTVTKGKNQIGSRRRVASLFVKPRREAGVERGDQLFLLGSAHMPLRMASDHIEGKGGDCASPFEMLMDSTRGGCPDSVKVLQDSSSHRS